MSEQAEIKENVAFAAEELSHATMPPISPRKPAVAFFDITLGHIVIALSILALAAAIYFRP